MDSGVQVKKVNVNVNATAEQKKAAAAAQCHWRWCGGVDARSLFYYIAQLRQSLNGWLAGDRGDRRCRGAEAYSAQCRPLVVV